MDALELLTRYTDRSGQDRFHASSERVPVDGVVPRDWRVAVVDETGRIERTPYELCVLRALRNAIRRREVSVVGANRWRDSEQDLPSDFEANRDVHYASLRQQLDLGAFITDLQGWTASPSMTPQRRSGVSGTRTLTRKVLPPSNSANVVGRSPPSTGWMLPRPGHTRESRSPPLSIAHGICQTAITRPVYRNARSPRQRMPATRVDERPVGNSRWPRAALCRSVMYASRPPISSAQGASRLQASS